MTKMKLSKEQKFNRKMLKRFFEKHDGLIMFDYNNHTIAALPMGNTYLVSIAILHPQDLYNRKYGEYIALRKLKGGDSIIMPAVLFNNWV